MKKLQTLSGELNAEIERARKTYKFQEQLTKKLDAHTGDFTEHTILEIVLWKVNRYPAITPEIINEINELKNNYSEEKGRKLLRRLLEKDVKGFDLPMASTLLRFALPDKFQIIDQRVFRFITMDKDKFIMPYNIDAKVELYFKYLKDLREACEKYNIPFSESDRLLYQMDKNLNADSPIKY